jgi:hypothetical protein
MNVQYKLGKQPARHDPRTLQFLDYRTSKLPLPIKRNFGHYQLVSDWGMLGNDQYGDCVFAGAAHETMMWTAEAEGGGVLVAPFGPEAVLSDYAAVTGFDPADPNTDRGAVVIDALNHRRNTGIVDSAGQRHRIGAYVALQPRDYTHVLEGVELFGAVGIGIEFPSSAMDQFNAGQPWTVVPHASIEGGHYVPVVGRDHGELLVVTWGKVQRMTRGFFEHYCDEAYAILSPECLVGGAGGAGGKSPEGFDLEQLQADLALV